MTENTNNRFIPVILFAVTALIYTYYYSHTPYDNAASRMDLAFSLALRGAASIDEYHTNTVDKSFYDGHYYSDKAPGLSFAAVPVIVAMKLIAPGIVPHPDNPAARTPVILLIIALPSALSVLLMYAMTRRLCGNGTAFPILVFAVGTLAFPYSCMFYSHQFCATLLIAAFYLWLREISDQSKRTIVSGFLMGFILSYAAITEYTSAVQGGLLLLLSFSLKRDYKSRAAMIAGGAIPLAALLVYNQAAFGNFLTIGYYLETHPWFREEMRKGIGGVTYPNPVALFNLLFAPQKGLFWGQPFLLLAIPGTIALWKAGDIRKKVAVAAAAFFIIQLLINSSYYEPYGGFAPGPRFLVAALPFLALLAAAGWSTMENISKGAAAGLGIFSIFYFQLITAVEPNMPHVFKAPLFQFTIPLITYKYTLTNLGTIIGIPDILSLIPPAIILFSTAVYFIIYDSRDDYPPDLLGGSAAGVIIMSVILMATAFGFESDSSKNAYYLGAAFQQNKKYDIASSFYAEALAMEPDYPEASYGYGIAQIKLGNYNDAITSFKETVRMRPDNNSYKTTLAAALITTGRLLEAERQILEGLRLDPNNPELLNLRSRVSKLTGATK